MGISFQGVFGSHTLFTDFSHFRFVKIGDSECSPQLDYVVHQASPDNYVYWRDHRKVRTCE